MATHASGARPATVAYCNKTRYKIPARPMSPNVAMFDVQSSFTSSDIVLLCIILCRCYRFHFPPHKSICNTACVRLHRHKLHVPPKQITMTVERTCIQVLDDCKLAAPASSKHLRLIQLQLSVCKCATYYLQPYCNIVPIVLKKRKTVL